MLRLRNQIIWVQILDMQIIQVTCLGFNFLSVHLKQEYHYLPLWDTVSVKYSNAYTDYSLLLGNAQRTFAVAVEFTTRMFKNQLNKNMFEKFLSFHFKPLFCARLLEHTHIYSSQIQSLQQNQWALLGLLTGIWVRLTNWNKSDSKTSKHM